ncbi:FHIPEP family type III secretion protein [Actinoplanes sp. NPDC051411]|uniref:FHIPEP family type III secretion protein n=1 Tax=Actinoplanes sp. NPDC051411 TaxID=3155522 RepID=UPI00343AA1C9
MTDTGVRAGSDLGDAADAFERTIGAAVLSRHLRRSADGLLAELHRADGYAEAIAGVEALQGELATFVAAVSALGTELRQIRDRRARIEPFGRDWMLTVRAEIAGAGEKATARWVRSYAEAYVAGRFDVCRWLCRATTKITVSPPELPGRDHDLSRRLLLGARAAASGDLATTLPVLTALTESELGQALPRDLSASLWCMRVRAVARGTGDPARGRDLVSAVLEWAGPERAVLASLHAAAGECLLATGDVAGATAEAGRAVRLAATSPAGNVLRGMIAEEVGDHASADEAYEEAADTAAGRPLGELFAPAPPNLLWQCGRRLREREPKRAASMIRAALRGGIRGAGRYPERKAYVDLARALEQQGKDDAAAKAYWEAGRRYAWVADEVSAAKYLTRACGLDRTSYRYAFEMAEVLRARAVHQNGTVDLDLLDQAAHRWREAYELGVPGAKLPWAYVTMALTEHERSGDLYRPHVSWEAVALLERGLLYDHRNVRTRAQLSLAHRLVGARLTAADLTEGSGRPGQDDELMFDQRLLALMEIERPEEALALAEAHGLREDQPWLVIRRVQLLLTLDRAAEALELLGTEKPADDALHALYLGLCHELLGDEDAARQAYEELAAGAGSAGPGGRPDLSAWGCYLRGRYDEAAQAYASLLGPDADDPSLRCKFGQVLLAAGDVDSGRGHLTAGIAATTSLWALTELGQIDLPRLASRLPDGSAAVFDEIRAALKDRADVLRRPGSVRSELDDLLTTDAGRAQRYGVRFALARIDLAGEAYEAALERYAELAADVPEAAEGVRVAAEQLRRSADRLADRGDPEASLALHRRLLELLSGLSRPPVEIAAAAHLRAALLELEAGREAEFAAHVADAFRSDSRVEEAPAVRAVLAAVLGRPDRHWAVVDAARRAGPPAGRLLAALDPAKLLRTGREEVGVASLFPLATPLALRVGPELPISRQLVDAVCRRIERDTGVPIPGIALPSLPDGAEPGRWAVELYEVEVARGTAADEDAALRHLEAVVRANLARLFSIDDLGTWLASVQGGDSCGVERMSLADRLELVRLLRLLLREQVSIVDGTAILEVVDDAPLEWSALDLLPAVRARLRPRLMPDEARRMPPVRLPEELEAAFAAGWSAAHPDRWQLPRAQATKLAERVADWLGGERPAGAVVVREPELRPYLWRLIAGLVPGPVWVLAEEELDDQ